MIIGLTGSLAAGKGVVSNFFKKKGFVYLSLSDELREVARGKGIEITRANLQMFGNNLREELGPGVLAKLVTDKIRNQQYRLAVVDGIRNPLEIEELRKLEGFYLISVDAPIETRFSRMKDRSREKDPMTYVDFLAVDSKDKGVGEDEITGQAVARCMAEANFRVDNSGELEDVEHAVTEIYDKIDSLIHRPSWEEYFIEISRAVAKRATCNRGRSGCVIAKEKQILVSGYVGSPNGLPHCDDVGHQFSEVVHPNGEKKQHCVRTTHAEQNAICQAAKLGISVKGSTLYCKMTPCSVCAKLIINSGINDVICEADYQGATETRELFKVAGIGLRILDDSVVEY